MAIRRSKWLARMGGRVGGRVRRFMPLGLAVTYLSLLLFGMVSDDHGMHTALQLLRECRHMERRIDKLQHDNHGLREEWQRLSKDRRFIEKIAREELGMVGERELIVRFR